MAIKHGMHGADRGRLDHRALADQLGADLGRSPGGMLFRDAQDCALDLKRQFVGMPIGPARAIV